MESTVLVKAFALIESLANGTSALAALATAAGVTKPTAHRILQSLVALRYVEPLGDGKYRLTPKLRQLSLGLDERGLAELIAPSLRELHEATGETVNLGVLRANRVVYVSVIESTHPLRRVGELNADDPVFTTALGRAIAANLPPETVDRMLRGIHLERRTPKTVTDVSQLRKLLAEARRNGYSIERDQTDLGVTCLGAPIFDRDEPVAAVSISAPSARAVGSEAKWIKALRRTAVDASKRLASRARATA